MKRLGKGFFVGALYDKVRPGYTNKIIPEINKILPDRHPLVLAEFGAGSGIFTKNILETELVIEKLYIVDPDKEALNLHKEKFKSHPVYDRIDYIYGDAEKSSLKKQSIDIIMTAQAFHWFDMEKTRIEWLRIMKPDSKVLILGRFHIPLNAATEEYIALTRFGKRQRGYKENIEAYSPENMELFFGHPVKRIVIHQEKESKNYDEFMGEMTIRINTSCSEEVIRQSKEITEKASIYFEKHKIKNHVELISETFYICDTIKTPD